MYYSKIKKMTLWSNYLWFSWMSLNEFLSKKQSKGIIIFNYIIPSNEINENRTYRLYLAMIQLLFKIFWM